MVGGRGWRLLPRAKRKQEGREQRRRSRIKPAKAAPAAGKSARGPPMLSPRMRAALAAPVPLADGGVGASAAQLWIGGKGWGRGGRA